MSYSKPQILAFRPIQFYNFPQMDFESVARRTK